MRRISRLGRSIDSLRQTPYTCIACRYRAAFTTSLPRTSIKDNIQNTLTGKLFRKKEEIPNDADIEEAERSLPAPTVAREEHSYRPATTWEGLEVVGGKSGWNDEWNFKGFIPAVSHRPMNNDQITVALHRAVVEVYTLYQAGKRLSIPSEPLSEKELLQDITTKVQFMETKDGAEMEYAHGQEKTKILKSLKPKPKNAKINMLSKEDTSLSSPWEAVTDSFEAVEDSHELEEAPTESEEVVAADRSEIDPLADEQVLEDLEEESAVEEDSVVETPQEKTEINHKELVASWNPLWLQVSLEDPKVKFAVLKRILQLTGLRLPDHQLSTLTTVQSLLSRLLTPPKPRKLSESPSIAGEISELANVTFTPRRITPVDKEVKVGRWKVIAKELERRHLPVTGNAGSLKREVRFRV